MDEENGTRLRLLLAVVLVVIMVGGTIDLVLDAPTDWLSFHVLFELGMIVAALVSATALWLGWWRSRQAVVAMARSLEERRAERDAWRASAEKVLDGLGRAIDRQFDTWGLTPAEREIALLILKGHGHKQIAGLTGRSERTVRQHAVTVYGKAGLGSRAELAAFFLQDLILPSRSPTAT